MEPTALPTKKRWRLLSKGGYHPGGYHPGGCHGHQFDTEDEAKAWIAQPYVDGSYTYDCVDVIQCTTCKQWHIAVDGLQGWSCQP